MMTQKMEDIGNPDLVKLIQDRISHQGRITFAEFMELALYAPGLGYYTAPGEKIGPRGDYYTTTDVHPLFGEMVGRQLVQIAEIPALRESSLVIVEMGAGKGLLCQDILNSVRRAQPKFYSTLTYWIIEKSPIMVQQQQERLRTYVKEDKVRWVEGLDHPAFAKGIEGFVVSNELLDSFPVHRLVKKEGKLKEIYVTFQKGRFVEVLDSLSTPDLVSYFEKLGLSLEEGQQVEVNLKALDWMRQVGQSLRKGIVITVDYGYPAAELYSSSRRRGTFLCYYKHRVSEDPYIRVGWQDMTAHVDFTSLALVGREVGLEVTGFTNQEYFLMGLGITREMESRLEQHEDPQSRERELLAMKNLIAPDGLGGVFKILVQHKSLEGLKLEGLMYRPFSPEVLFSL
jgi:SAM-dependent MidA family methyltransferase